MYQTLLQVLETEYLQSRLNPLTLGTYNLVGIANLTAYFILAVSQVIKYIGEAVVGVGR